ncbi:RNA 2',3'-cyclic phosphodiesterase [Streptomyces sp. NPDC052236]|uniref:RNA 2',3'-cyclic phosphodiesterase n=1 Tax=Streptomyces sp. NPDC052236 TaxID=3365686 RepID=UPI0037CF8E34
MRLFAAVIPPPLAVDELDLAVARLKALPGAEHLRWTGRPSWHFTLAFMGQVDDELLPELNERLARAARKTNPFALRLRRGGHFGRRALWVGVEGGVAEMRLLADRADAAARRTGISMEEHRSYHAHLTIARSRDPRGADLRPYVQELEPFEGPEWDVAKLALVRSNLPVSGVVGEQPRYETVGSWLLGGGTESGPGSGSLERAS